MLSLLEKRLHGDLSDRKEVDKAVAALQRRGFSWGDIKNALEEYGASSTSTNNLHPLRAHFCAEGVILRRNARLAVTGALAGAANGFSGQAAACSSCRSSRNGAAWRKSRPSRPRSR
ncbi:MAG: hypothetical protein ACLR4Z_16745 [Butyricicoccaceae bacterium]